MAFEFCFNSNQRGGPEGYSLEARGSKSDSSEEKIHYETVMVVGAYALLNASCFKPVIIIT